MRLIGIDPGRTIGMAYVRFTDGTAQHAHGADFQDPIACYRMCTSKNPETVVFVIEQYYGSGLQSRDGEHTLRVYGYLLWRLQEEGLTVVPRSPQSRLHMLDEASKWYPKYVDRHKRDALAHALSYANERR